MLIINKFGGGIINGSTPIKHLSEILKNFNAEDYSVNVFSAFGKTTNVLGGVIKSCLDGNPEESKKLLDNLQSFHTEIARELFPEDHKIFMIIEEEFKKINEKLSLARKMSELQFIDQVLPHGEILASLIVGNYLEYVGISNKLINATDFLKTDFNFGSANVDKNFTTSNLKLFVNQEVFKLHKNIITQGFIGFTESNNVKYVTTLGREGSDYTAGLLGDILNADKVILWKDVPGVMDKNPKSPGGENAKKIDFLTYEELENLLQSSALGLVHPKTLNEVKIKKIPLQVRPFWDLDSLGTQIS